MCSLLSLIAKIPLCIVGCKVLTLPSKISSKPVISEISNTFIPFSFKYLKVPPVDIISTPLFCSAVARSKTFSLSKSVIEDIQRGVSDYDDSTLREVANDFSQIENSIILSGLSGANIDGIITNPEIKSIEVKSTKDILAGVAKAMGVFNQEFVSGTFKLVVSSQTLGKLYTEFFDGFSVKTKLDDILGSNEIIVNQTIGDDKALLISQRGGDFEFYSGLDVCVGFEKELDKSIELFLLQTLSFRVINPEAAILLNLK